MKSHVAESKPGAAAQSNHSTPTDTGHTDNQQCPVRVNGSMLSNAADSSTQSAVSGPQEKVKDSDQGWKAGKKEWMIIIVLAIVSLMVALDATILVPVLPMFCELYYIPFYLESVKDFSPTTTGVALMPLTGALLPTSVIVGRLMTKLGRYRWAIWLGWAVSITGTGLLILLDTSIQTYAWILIFVVVGLGHGLILMSYNFSVQAMADSRNVAYAAGMYTFARTLGMCIGVAVGGAVFQNELKEHLRELQLPAVVANDAENFVVRLHDFPKASVQYQAFILAYANSFKVVFEVLTALAGLAALLSLFIKEYTMDKELDSEHILRQEKQPSSPEANVEMHAERKRG
ncbi:MAG: hypothetical protein Q9170_002789 [Blastenia crenularia]